MSGSCQFISSFEMTCPLCAAVVPAKTPHRCEVTDETPKPTNGRGRGKSLVGLTIPERDKGRL